MTSLERSYSRLLMVYPRWYRVRRAEEILGTLLEAAAPDQRRPRASEALHLIIHGLAVRADVGAGGALNGLLSAAASPGLASAGVFALVMFLFGEWVPWSSGAVWPTAQFGPFLTIGPVVYLAWILAAALDVATRSRHRRAAVVVALTFTVLAVPLGNALGTGRPPLFVLVPLAMLGLPCMVRSRWAHGRIWMWPSLVAALVTLAVLGTTAVLPVVAGSPSYFPLANTYSRTAFYHSGVGVLAAWVPLAVLLVLAGAVVAAIAGHRDLAGALVLLVTPWLVLSAAHAPRSRTAKFSEVAVTLLLVTIAAIGVCHQRRITWQGQTDLPHRSS